jgi:hypothetical protein
VLRQSIISVHIVVSVFGFAFAAATHAWAWQGSLGPQSASAEQASSLFSGAGSPQRFAPGSRSEIAGGASRGGLAGALLGAEPLPEAAAAGVGPFEHARSPAATTRAQNFKTASRAWC